MSSNPSFTIRSLTHKDLAAVVAIEARCYAYPWNKSLFHSCLSAGYYCLGIFTPDQRLAGYGIYSTILDEGHILNICTDPQRRRQGLACRLLKRIHWRAAAQGVMTLFLEVRPSNHAAIALYKYLGYRHVGTRKNYYRGKTGREDAHILSCELQQDS